MEIFTKDTSFIKKNIEYLKNQIYRGQNLSSKSSLVYSFDVLSQLAAILDVNVESLKKVNKNKGIINKVFEKESKLENKKLENFIKNKKQHLEITSTIFSEDKDILIPEPKKIYESRFLDDEEIYEIISDFFLSTFNLDAFAIFKRLVELKKMYLVNLDGFEYNGITFFNTYMNDARIIINESNIDNTIDLMTALVHEIGHVMDFEYLGRNSTYYCNKSIFTEVLSHLYEKEFMDYLIENNIYKRKTTNRFIDYYETMRENIIEIALECNIPDNLLKKEKYRGLEKGKLYDKIFEQAELPVQEEEFPVPSTISLIDSLEYGYGIALATYFSGLKKTDRKMYQSEIARFMGLRIDYFPNNFLRELGTTRDFLEKTLDEEIISAPCKIMIKK